MWAFLLPMLGKLVSPGSLRVFGLPAVLVLAGGFIGYIFAGWLNASEIADKDKQIASMQLTLLTIRADMKLISQAVDSQAKLRAQERDERQAIIDKLQSRKPFVQKTLIEDRYIYLDSNNRSVCPHPGDSDGSSEATPATGAEDNHVSSRLDIHRLSAAYEACRTQTDALIGFEGRIEDGGLWK